MAYRGVFFYLSIFSLSALSLYILAWTYDSMRLLSISVDSVNSRFSLLTIIRVRIILLYSRHIILFRSSSSIYISCLSYAAPSSYQLFDQQQMQADLDLRWIHISIEQNPTKNQVLAL